MALRATRILIHCEIVIQRHDQRKDFWPAIINGCDFKSISRAQFSRVERNLRNLSASKMKCYTVVLFKPSISGSCILSGPSMHGQCATSHLNLVSWCRVDS